MSDKKIIIYTDGASRGNPGPSGIGTVIDGDGYFDFIGEGTNNEAEYKAVIFALKKTKAIFGKKNIKEKETELRSDSELLIKQLNGQYKILEPRIQQLFLEVWNLRIDFGNLKFFLIPREENKEADKLANQALDRLF